MIAAQFDGQGRVLVYHEAGYDVLSFQRLLLLHLVSVERDRPNVPADIFNICLDF